MPGYAELERRDLPFLLHPISPPGLDCMLELNLANVVGFMFETTLAAARLVFAGVFERCPRLHDFSSLGRPRAVSHGTAAVRLRAFPGVQRKLKRAA